MISLPNDYPAHDDAYRVCMAAGLLNQRDSLNVQRTKAGEIICRLAVAVRQEQEKAMAKSKQKYPWHG